GVQVGLIGHQVAGEVAGKVKSDGLGDGAPVGVPVGDEGVARELGADVGGILLVNAAARADRGPAAGLAARAGNIGDRIARVVRPAARDGGAEEVDAAGECLPGVVHGGETRV